VFPSYPLEQATQNIKQQHKLRVATISRAFNARRKANVTDFFYLSSLNKYLRVVVVEGA
jgi:hypothetical protein